MRDLITHFYPWILAGHIIAVMFWMAAMYYLPRLFVYHAEAMSQGESYQIFERMEANLMRIIMTPAMLIAWAFGGTLLLRPGFWTDIEVWIFAKLFLVFFLTAYHGFLALMRRKFLGGKNPYSARVFRLINEIPPIMTIFIVILVVVRPF